MPTATIAGSISGGAGTNTLDYSAYTSPLTWNLGSANAGAVAGVGFTSVGNLIGSAGDNKFVFANGATITGSITGGSGANTLNYSAYTAPVTMNLGANTATGTGGASGVRSFIGGTNANTLVGPTADSTWNLTGLNSGTVAGVSFTNVQNLTGAANNKDTFILHPAGQVSGTIDGGAGGYDKVVFDLGSGNLVTYAPTGSQSGTVTQGGRTFTFAGMEPIQLYSSNFSDAKNVTITGDPLGADTLSLTYFSANLVEFSGAGENIAFPIPLNSLTIGMSALGNNNLTIGSATPLVLPGSLTITSGLGDNKVVLAGALTLGGGLYIPAVTGKEEVTLNAALTVLAGGLTIDSHLGLNQTVQVNAPANIQGDVLILGSALADTVTLNAPLNVSGGNVTIESTVTALDKQFGSDTVTLDGNVYTHGGAINVDAATINVGQNGQNGPVTVSTRNLELNNPTTFVGNSGAIHFDSKTITMRCTDTQLLANADANGTYKPGDVTLSVFVYDPSGALPIDVLPSPNPGISVLKGAQIFGGQITMTAHKQSEAQLLQFSLLSLQSKSATITITDATIDGSTGVAIQANAEDASGQNRACSSRTTRLSPMPCTMYRRRRSSWARFPFRNAVPARS